VKQQQYLLFNNIQRILTDKIIFYVLTLTSLNNAVSTARLCSTEWNEMIMYDKLERSNKEAIVDCFKVL
jgi:hypothetical protein